jgi:ATP-dependent DNA ligase
MLKIRPPFLPMEAQSVDALPRGREWQYEPKWDGFRCLTFRDGKRVELQSKSGKPLTRYFPEIAAAVAALKPGRFVLDGEILMSDGNQLSFDALLQRIHPAKSRIDRLAAETPAMVIVFDLLLDERGRSLVALPLQERRKRLEAFSAKYLRAGGTLRLSPMTVSYREAERWLRNSKIGLDGVIAKERTAEYRSDDRSAMQKVKNYRSVDCVVGGFRHGTGSRLVGSLLLGLYDDDGKLNHVGFTATIRNTERKALTERLEKLIGPPGFTGDAPGGPSRWSTERSAQWKPLKSKLVVEVSFDHFSGGRFRHGTSLLRWRPDKSPRQCTYDQLKLGRGSPLRLLNAGRHVRRGSRARTRRARSRASSRISSGAGKRSA